MRDYHTPTFNVYQPNNHCQGHPKEFLGGCLSSLNMAKLGNIATGHLLQISSSGNYSDIWYIKNAMMPRRSESKI